MLQKLELSTDADVVSGIHCLTAKTNQAVRRVDINCSSLQVRSTGGPSPQAATIFNIANHTVATVSNVGLVEAQQLGTTNLTGLVQASDPVKGQTVLHSKVTLLIFEVLCLH